MGNFAPVTIGRVILDDVAVGDCPMNAGERVLVALQSANRDGAHFERPEEVSRATSHCVSHEVALLRHCDRRARFEWRTDPNGAV